MPPAYDFHHIELDKVGRGKKRLSLESVDGGIKGVLLTQTKKCVVNGSGGSSNVSSNASSPNSSRATSRRGSIVLDTKNRLFGPPVQETPRKVKDLFKSSIFSEDTNKTPPKIIPSKTKAVYTPARRNPITGEPLDISKPIENGKVLECKTTIGQHRANSLGSSIGSSPGTPSIASSSLSIDSSSLSSLPSN